MNYLLFLVLCTFAFDFAATLAIRKDPIRLVHQFEGGTWIENVAVRANGQLLLTFLQEPLLVLLDPIGNQDPVLVHRFLNATALSGIAEISPDVFAVAAGNYSLTAGATQGSWSIWRVDMTGVSTSGNSSQLIGQPIISKITDLPSAIFLNGMSNIPENDKLILVGDIKAGLIYSVDLETQTSEVVVSNFYAAAGMQATFGEAGVDGLHVRNGFLFLTNLALAVFVKMPISPQGRPTGNTTLIANPIRPKYDYFDDFTFDREGNAYLVTGSGNSVEEITIGGKQRTIAGGLNSTAIAEPTAVQFGRGATDQKILYAVTAGGLASPVDGSMTVGAQVVAIDISISELLKCPSRGTIFHSCIWTLYIPSIPC